ncbi:MAG: type II secretion system protein M [Acidobacteria bacterium]|nr:type II secretion system protein M [Acidobacteriota bacterium]
MQLAYRDKVALGVAGIGVVLYVLFQFVVFPAWDSMQEVRASLPIQEKKLAKYRELAATAPLRRTEASSQEARLRETEGGLLNSKNGALASAELQQLIKQLTAAQAIDIRSSDFLPSRRLSPDYVQIPVGLQFTARLDQLVGLLTAASESPKLLSVSSLMVQTGGTPKERLINVNVRIAGIMRAETAN